MASEKMRLLARAELAVCEGYLYAPINVLYDALEMSGRMLQLLADAVVLLAVAGAWLLSAGVAVLIVRRRFGRRLVALWGKLLSW
jgi:hypothetical protein